MRTTAGCTPHTAAMPSMNTPKTVVKKSDGLYYRYGPELEKLRVSRITIPFKQAAGVASRSFTVYHSHHGPIIRAENGKWIAVKLLQVPVPALSQSYLRTKTTDYASFRKTQDMRTDTSNNTVYADANGTIAYFHGNFIPKRDTSFDFTHPVDGSNPATEWQGPHAARGHHHLAQSQQRLAFQQQ